MQEREPRLGAPGATVCVVISPSAGDDSLARQALVDRVLADRPVVHYMSEQDVEAKTLTGVWSTEESCYRFLADRCRRGDRTLETGSGISTVLFAAWGTLHTCVVPGPEEIEAVLAYCKSHALPTDGLTFVAEPSDDALTNLDEGLSLDLVLIDGSHGFPAPMIDWYYGAGRLRRGGVLLVDDIDLPAVQVLDGYLRSDPRWVELSRTSKWVAFERRSEGSLREDWYVQPFYSGQMPVRSLFAKVGSRVRPVLGRAKRGLSFRGASTNHDGDGSS